MRERFDLVKNLRDQDVHLSKELTELRKLKDKLEKLLQVSESELLYKKWNGIEVKDAAVDSCHVSFTPLHRGISAEYTIGFKLSGPCWSVAYKNLPPFDLSQLFINVSSVNHLCSDLSVLRHTVYMFWKRKEQFKDVQSLSSSHLSLFPSINTRNLTILLDVNDVKGDSDLSQVTIILRYGILNYLPEKPYFSFTGGDRETHEAFEKQLQCLQHLPLKEALVSAFSLQEGNSSLDGYETENSS